MRCESYLTRLQRFRGKVNLSRNIGGSGAQLRIAAESKDKIPITSSVSVLTTRSLRNSDWRRVGGAVCRRFDVDDRLRPGVKE